MKFATLALIAKLKRSVLRESNETKNTEFNRDAALMALSDERFETYKNYIRDDKTEQDCFRSAARMHKNGPDLFEIYHPQLFPIYDEEFKGSSEGKAFLKFYCESIADIKDDTDEELDIHHKIVCQHWNNLRPSVRSELEVFSPRLDEYIKDPYCNFERAREELSPERLEVFQTFFSQDFDELTEAEMACLWSKTQREDPDIFYFLKVFYMHDIKNYDGSEEAKHFLELYYTKDMADESKASFNKYIDNLKREWNKLDQKSKTDLIISHPEPAALMGEEIDRDEAIQKLSLKDQKTCKEFLEADCKDGRDFIKTIARFHKDHPNLYYKIGKLHFMKGIRDFDGGKEAKDFLKYYFFQIDHIHNDSDTQVAIYTKHINRKWSELSQQAKDQLKEVPLFFTGLIEDF